MFIMINFISNQFKKHPAIRFLFIGGFNTMLCLIVYYLLLKLNLHYLVASSITNIFGILNGFLLNSILVFKHRAKLSRLLRYLFVYAISFLLNIFIMYVFVGVLYLPKFISQIITIAILAIFNYQLIKRVVFSIV
jgi:putative flippase GtrA